jgi:hypothetical protein
MSGSPGEKNILKNTVNNRRITIAFNPFTMKPKGTLDNLIIDTRNIVTTTYPYKDWNRNSDAINRKVPINFTLGSNRCNMESVG